jgi:hypothetical protein
VFCLDARTGRRVWRSQLGGSIVHASAIARAKKPEDNVVLTKDYSVYGYMATAGQTPAGIVVVTVS